MADDSLTMAPAAAGVSFAARLSFERVSHQFTREQPILSDISLTVEPGEILCLLGPSGSGKTTLLRIAAGIEVQTAGRVLMNEREIAGPSVFVPPEKRSIGLVFQDFALFPHLTILDNVRFGLTALSRDESEREARLALARVGLEHYASAYPHALSGGEQQRVALARALAPRPAVLLMDEPFSGLDSRLRDTVRAETLAILRRSRATAVVVTHDAEEAMRLGDRIALLRKGRLVQAGTPQMLYNQPRNLFVASFFAELNIFDARVRAGAVETPLGKFDAGHLAEGTPVWLAARASGIELSDRAGDIEGRILGRRFLGEMELVEVAISGADIPLRARIRCGALAEGVRNVWVGIRDSDVLLFERNAEKS
jgi:iron(III) transport system ATP-binding protein